MMIFRLYDANIAKQITIEGNKHIKHIKHIMDNHPSDLLLEYAKYKNKNMHICDIHDFNVDSELGIIRLELINSYIQRIGYKESLRDIIISERDFLDYVSDRDKIIRDEKLNNLLDINKCI